MRFKVIAAGEPAAACCDSLQRLGRITHLGMFHLPNRRIPRFGMTKPRAHPDLDGRPHSPQKDP
jgi:hypothetical protein